MKANERMGEWANESSMLHRVMRFLRTQAVHTGITAIVLAALFLGAARAGALNGVLASTMAATSSNFTTINYQGRLMDSGGNPINNIDQGLDLTFSLYDAESGGSAVWTETHAGVPISDGLFNVRLGSISALSTDLLAGDRWLGVQVGTDPEMSPREKLAAVPYAMQAGESGYATVAESVALASMHEFVRDTQTPVLISYVQVGDSQIALARPGKVYVNCDVTLQPDSTPKRWVSLRVVATKGSTKIKLDEPSYHGTASERYTSWSASGIISLPEAGAWTIQCELGRSHESDNPIIHTYSITAFQVE
ncbi:MAG: hypothetical protein DRJ03_26765 [Chloroflexi bacterium]|nr:MAG: hypothetical protein DRJ03_26765 [Chloroflexota bacterium]